MDTIVIVCLIVGVACLGASFILKDEAGIDGHEKDKIAEEIRTKALSDESMKKAIAKANKSFSDKLSDISEDKLGESTDKMSEIANSKMLAINEMSGQLIEKIEQNHKEVIFLYDMLNEKSDNLKDFSAKIDGLRKELENEEKRIKALNNDLDDKIVKVKEVRQTVITKSTRQAAAEQERTGNVSIVVENSGNASAIQEKPHRAVSNQAQSLVQLQNKQGTDKTHKQPAEREVVTKDIEKEAANVKQPEIAKETEEQLSTNDKILKMKEEGKSIVEISKALGMGQGEVQLVLGLFGK